MKPKKGIWILASAIIAVLFISGCAAQQTQPTQTSTPSASPITTSPSPTTPEKHFTKQTSGISLTSDVENKVGEISDCYFTKTQKPLVVTSGTRGSTSQAQAMFDKLELGDNLSVYKNKVARDEIVEAYNDGVAAGEEDSEIVADMTDVIDDQISQGVYISRHLISGAVDFSQKGMTATDKAAFENCAKSTKGVGNVIDEDKPVHFHIEIASEVKLATLTTSTTGSGYGEIISSLSKCESECTVNVGTKVTLTAKADDDSEFDSWSGDCSGTTNCVLTMDKDKTVAAKFKLKELPSITPITPLEPTPNVTATPTTPTPTQTPEEASTGSIDSASCVNERNQYGYVQKTTLSVSGRASGSVGTVLYSSLTPTCSSWSKGMGVTCVRKEGEPSETSWTATGAWLDSQTSYGVSITGLYDSPSITFACQG